MKTKHRQIPTTMSTQHPDHASKPFWHTGASIQTRDEAKECFTMFKELDIPEYNWDWEGKLVDESVIERFLSEHYEYFKENPIGKEKFLTYRLPNPFEETEFRLGRALMGLLSASGEARKAGLHNPPLFEVILPMTESAEQMISIQEAFREIATLEHRLFNLNEEKLKHIEIIPLIEEANLIANSKELFEEYFVLHKYKFGFTPKYMRPYIARSDPALNAGIVPTVLAIKMALSGFREFEEEHKVDLYPMLGAASLPFRGGVNPYTVDQFVNEYEGLRTTTVQSAFKYDYPLKDVKKAIKELDEKLPTTQAQLVSDKDREELMGIIKKFSSFYRKTVEGIADKINLLAGYRPPRRERVQHVGLFGYSRGVGKVSLPRAIGFTCSLYSLGAPPEFLGTGRGLTWAAKNDKLALIEKYHKNIRNDLRRAGKFVNKELVKKLAKDQKHEAWEQVLEDISGVEQFLGAELGPESKDEKEHLKVTEEIYSMISTKAKPAEDLTKLITKGARLRKAMG